MALPIFPPLSVICNVRKLGRNDCTFSVHCLAPPQPNICAAFFGWCMLFLKCTNISRRSNVQELRYTREIILSLVTHLALPVVMKALKCKTLGGIHMQSTAGSSYGAMHIHNIIDNRADRDWKRALPRKQSSLRKRSEFSYR